MRGEGRTIRRAVDLCIGKSPMLLVIILSLWLACIVELSVARIKSSPDCD